MKNIKKIVGITFIVLIAIIFILPFAAFGIIKWGILPPEKLTPLVVREVNKLIDGHLECERIELTYIETYPRLGIRLMNGKLISYATRDSLSQEEGTYILSDTLVTFNRALVSVNPTDYLFNEKVTIGGVFMENPSIYAYINEEGKANWEIYTSEEDTIGVSADTIKTIPPIDLQKVRIKNGNFVYDNRQTEIYAEIDSFSLRMNGELTRRGNKFDIQTQTKSIYFENPSYKLENKLAIEFKSEVRVGNNFNYLRLKEAEMLINNLPFTADGRIINYPDSGKVKVDMDLALQVSDMNDVLAFIPDEYFQNRKKIQAKGSVLLESNIHGIVSDSLMPTINLICKVEKGSYHMKGVKQGIDEFEMDMNLHLNGAYPDSSFVNLSHLRINGMNTSFVLKGRVEDLYRSPFIDGTMKGTIDFTQLAKEFLNPDTLLLQGKMDADITAAFCIDDLMDAKYNNVRAAGELSFDRFRARSRYMGLDLLLSGVNFSVDSVKQTSSFLTNDDLLSAFLKVDSMRVRYKREINTTLKGVDIQAKTTVVPDTNSVIPLTTHIKIESIRSGLPDSVWVVAKNTSLRGGIKPSSSNKQIPNIAASISVDTLRYFDIPARTGMSLATNVFNIEALPYREAMRQYMAGRGQSSRRNMESRQSTRARSMTGQGEENPDVSDRGQITTNNRQRRQNDSVSSANSGGLLRNWEIRGSVRFNQMRVFSRMFPLPMRMEQTEVKFTTDNFTLKGAKFHAGKSNFIFNGEISNMRRALLRGGKLTGNLAVASDYIDCNQLLNAFNKGMEFMEGKDTVEVIEKSEEELIEMNDEELAESIQEIVTDSTEVLFVVPKNLDLVLKMDAKKIDFQDLNLENVGGEIVVRNQSINLKKLDMDSNIGSASLTMVYTAKDRQEASTGFELKMDDILVDRLIGFFPSIDSLLPMLRSFEGVVDCQMAATCSLDSTMSVILPSLHSACYLHGENMVLLDGETFAEISKTLMFKNKKRNVIDNISVDLFIKDNKIEIYPFLVEMDRYRVAVGGEHHLDMTFDYHLSVLKSPVPFKLGIDIKGNLDDFKYKIVKCRYKDIFKPAREAELDVTRMDLRADIRDRIRKEMLTNAPELAKDLNLEESVRTRVRGDNPPRRNPRPLTENDSDEEKEEGMNEEASNKEIL